MERKGITRVVIAGGGTAGWIAAAAMAKLLGEVVDITLVESDAIGTVGVGEATIPQILRLNGILGIEERDFLRETHATYKLGIEFSNWGRVGERYLHTFGEVGLNLTGLPFHHYWLRAKRAGHAGDYWDYSIHKRAADGARFAHMPRVGNTSMSGLSYAYHFDAGAYAAFLRRYSEARGVRRQEGRIADVERDAETGDVTALRMEDGTDVAGDLFIDCTGFRALLLGGALSVGYRDWSEWLPCNSAVTVGCARTEPLLPFTKSIAHEAGWQWRIPLQHRTGNGHVFCDRYVSRDQAEATLLGNLDAGAIGEPRHIRFTTGRRERFWERNVVALGLSSGFLEPLESTSIHFIQSQVGKLIELFPRGAVSEAARARYNHDVGREFEQVRDFLVLHYKLTQRDDTPFWRDCAAMDVPDSLTQTLALFRDTGRVQPATDDLFRAASWTQVMLGQNLEPRDHHPRADAITDDQLTEFLSNVRALVRQNVDALPSHAAFVARAVS